MPQVKRNTICSNKWDLSSRLHAEKGDASFVKLWFLWIHRMWAKRFLPAAFQLWPLWTYFHIHTIGEHLYFPITVLPKRAKMSATLLEISAASKLWLIIDSKLDFHTDCAASLILKDVVFFVFFLNHLNSLHNNANDFNVILALSICCHSLLCVSSML